MRSIRKAAAKILKGEDLEFIGTPCKTDLPREAMYHPELSEIYDGRLQNWLDMRRLLKYQGNLVLQNFFGRCQRFFA